MPSSYTHQSFAENLLSSLPEEIRDIISSYKNAYLLGSLGPDPLFFYKPLSHSPYYALGDEIHSQGIKKTLSGCSIDEKEKIAFLLGYITHYVLDKNCHEYIYRIDKDNQIHHILEAELDKRTALKEKMKISFTKRMKRKGCSFSYIPSILQIEGKEYSKAVSSMRRLTGFLNSRLFLKRMMTRFLLSFSRKFRKYKEGMFSLKVNHGIDEEIHVLEEIVSSSYEECKENMIEFYQYVSGKKEDISFGDRMSFEGERINSI